MPSPRAHHARKPKPQGTGTTPSASVRWTLEHLNRLLSIARQAEGQIAGLPASSWWPAFLLTILDTALAPKALLAVAMEDYRQQRVAVGLITYELHPHAVAAIENLSHRAHLFPWPWSTKTLNSRLKQLAALGDLPSAPFPFQTLREAARSEHNLLDRLDLTTDFAPVQLPSPAETKDEPEEELAPENTLVGYAQRYPDLRLELRYTTAYLYVVVARMFERFHKRPILLTDLTTELVLKFLKSLVADGRSPATANSHRTTILTLWSMAHEKGLAPPIPKKFDLPKFKVPRKSPVSWRPEQLQTLLEICEAQIGSLPQWPTIKCSDFWFSLILFLYEGGARIGGALGVTPADIDFENGIIVLRSETAKTHLEQAVRVSETTLQAIRRIWNPNREYVWPCGKKRNVLYDTLTQLQIAAGLPTDRKSKFHRIRRTNATQTALHGSLEMAQRQLGHANVQMTLRAYIDTTVLKPIQAVDVLPQLVGAKGGSQ